MRGKVGYYNILTIDHVWIFNFSHFQKEFVQHFYKMDDQQKPLHKKQNKQINKQAISKGTIQMHITIK